MSRLPISQVQWEWFQTTALITTVVTLLIIIFVTTPLTACATRAAAGLFSAAISTATNQLSNLPLTIITVTQIALI
jgi:hypothetical protein